MALMEMGNMNDDELLDYLISQIEKPFSEIAIGGYRFLYRATPRGELEHSCDYGQTWFRDCRQALMFEYLRGKILVSKEIEKEK